MTDARRLRLTVVSLRLLRTLPCDFSDSSLPRRRLDRGSSALRVRRADDVAGASADPFEVALAVLVGVVVDESFVATLSRPRLLLDFVSPSAMFRRERRSPLRGRAAASPFGVGE